MSQPFIQPKKYKSVLPAPVFGFWGFGFMPWLLPLQLSLINCIPPLPIMSLTASDVQPPAVGDKSPKQIAAQWGVSPVPAWAFSAALLLSPALRPQFPVLSNPNAGDMGAGGKSSSMLRSAKAPLLAYPSNIQVLVFSSFIGLGGFMCYDHDPTNGAAVAGCWSLLYFLTNVKRSMWNLKVYPKALTSLALVNSAIYSAKYLNLV